MLSVYLLSLFAAHATCSVSMVLLNKTLAMDFDYPWTVVFVQNIGTVFIGFIWPLIFGDRNSDASKGDIENAGGADSAAGGPRKICGLAVPRKFKNKLWSLLQCCFFCLTLYFSLKALRFMSVPLYVVARNTVPAATAVVEWSCTNTKINALPIVGLFLTIIGAVLYSVGDFLSQNALDFVGLTYAGFLIFIVATCSVIDKTAVRILREEEEIKPHEVAQNRSFLSLPVNIVLILLFELYKTNTPKSKADGTAAGGHKNLRQLFELDQTGFFDDGFLSSFGDNEFRLSSDLSAGTSPTSSSSMMSAPSHSQLLPTVLAGVRHLLQQPGSSSFLYDAAALTSSTHQTLLLSGGPITSPTAGLSTSLQGGNLASSSSSSSSQAALISSNTATQQGGTTTSLTQLPTTAFLQEQQFSSALQGSSSSSPDGASVLVPPLFQAFQNDMTTVLWTCLFLSTIFGFGMGTFNFYLNQAVNAATVQVANILYKLTTTILSRFSHPTPVAFSSWCGFGLSLAGIALYTFGNQIQDHFSAKNEAFEQEFGLTNEEIELEDVAVDEDEDDEDHLHGTPIAAGGKNHAGGQGQTIGRSSGGRKQDPDQKPILESSSSSRAGQHVKAKIGKEKFLE
ncbi:unnamed protein product [Amoebophrya sp. A120]|nr:unnamed protein product [Amoebophrya sp. A120]|eukprot:GSA120T00008568001.1